MRLRDFAILGIGVMILFQITTSFSSIYLLTRMSPAIERILSENVNSNAAVEAMLSSLVVGDSAEDQRKSFYEALARARKNITVPGETDLLDEVERKSAAALDGDLDARKVVSEKLRELAHINRMSMRSADEEAKRIGNAGAWTMTILGVVGFLAGALVLRRIVRKFIAPIEEIGNVLAAQIAGESSRRVVLRNSASDIRELGMLINEIIDARSVKDIHEKRDMERTALLYFMDKVSSPIALLSPQKETLAANHAMEKLLRDDEKESVDALIEVSSQGGAVDSEKWKRTTLLDGTELIEAQTVDASENHRD